MKQNLLDTRTSICVDKIIFVQEVHYSVHILATPSCLVLVLTGDDVVVFGVLFRAFGTRLARQRFGPGGWIGSALHLVLPWPWGRRF